MQAIAERVGVRAPSLYKRVRDRDALLRLIAEATIDELGDRLAASEGGYFAAKLEQERLVRASGRAFSIVHATQFFEFLLDIADSATQRGIVRVAHALIQPMAADDVAAAVLRVARGEPTGTVTEFAGPDRFRLDSVVRTRLWAHDDPREVVADPLATYFGTDLEEDELLPGEDAIIMPTRFDDWIRDVA